MSKEKDSERCNEINAAETPVGAADTYPDGFFDLFGTGKNLGFDAEPEDIRPEI